MDRNLISKRMAFMVFFILGVNTLAMIFHWYSSLWWFDMPMHFMGGVFLGLLFARFSVWDFSKNFIIKMILFTLLVGIGWEIFEVLVDKNISKNPFDLLDTLSDLFFDVAGCISAFLILKRRLFRV